MISIAQILKPEHIHLSLKGENQLDAVQEVLFSLRGDVRVPAWEDLRSSVMERNAPAVAAGGCGVVIAHGRTNAVNALVMGAGRLSEGFHSDDIPEKVRFVFVAGIPTAFNNEYLRVVGSIARLCSRPDLLNELIATATPKSFLEILASAELKL
jgi:mannitol/fructose-specific phosphotransferase system IIA component (Ntr-type)